MRKKKEFTRFSSEDVQNRIEIVRAAWEVEQTDRGCVMPRWWNKKKYDSMRNSGVFDHLGRIGDVVVSEPYFNEHTADIIDEAKRIANDYDLDVRFSLMSWHYPGRTIRFTWIPRDLV